MRNLRILSTMTTFTFGDSTKTTKPAKVFHQPPTANHIPKRKFKHLDGTKNEVVFVNNVALKISKKKVPMKHQM